MKTIGKFYRLIYINYVLAKNGFDEIIFATRWFAPFGFLSYLNPWYWLRNRKKSPPEQLRLTLEELGPIFVKFGQMLSTRQDLLPEDYATSLATLQDKVKPFSGARRIIETALGNSVDVLFTQFEDKALASASIAQVHAATLPHGHEIVIKVKRPGIEKIISRDIALLYMFARLLEKYTTFGKRIHAAQIVAEFEKTIKSELDLMREAANASILRRNFKNSAELYIPQVYWEYCRDNVMVMERIYGIPIADIESLKAHHINLEQLTKNCVKTFFTQVFRDCFFHADLHPGNLFVDPTTPDNPRYIAIDFGIIGTLTTFDQKYLAENLLAFFKRDYRRVAELHLLSGWIPKDTSVQEFELAISSVCEPIFQKPLKEISFGQLLLRLFQTGKRFHMEIQPQLLLLQKTLVHIEGLGRQLCPELDLWASAEPIVDKWVREQFSVKSFYRKIKANLPIWIEQFPEMPTLIYKGLKNSASLQATVTLESDIIEERNNTFGAGFSFALVLLGIVIGVLSYTGVIDRSNIAYVSMGAGIVGVLGFLWIIGMQRLKRL